LLKEVLLRHEEFEGTQDASIFRLPQAVYDRFDPRELAVAEFMGLA
jgi:hypothetical protein